MSFEVKRKKYHLKDLIEGFVKFKKVSIRLVSMELQLIKKETILAGSDTQAETEVLTRFEIMDGGPIKNETIPIKWFIAPYDLTPSYPDINSRLSVQYFINLVLIDVEERKYFKQSEITLVRVDKQAQKNMTLKREESEKLRDSEREVKIKEGAINKEVSNKDNVKEGKEKKNRNIE